LKKIYFGGYNARGKVFIFIANNAHNNRLETVPSYDTSSW